MSWPTVELQEVCRTGSGTTPSRKNTEFYSGNIPWVKSGELRETEIMDTEEHVSEEAIKSTSLKIVPPGSLLVAMYGATVGRVGLLGVEATTNQAVCHVIPDPQKADNRYLFHLLQERAQELIGRGVGGAQPNINQGTIKQLQIPLPPLDEQKRIAAILDQAGALRRLRQRTIDRLNTLGQAIFHKMFSSEQAPVVKKLSDIAELINGDRSSNYPSGNDIKEDGILFLSTKNISSWRLALQNPQFITPEKFQSLSRGKLQRGDIVITLRGTLGQAAIFDCEYDTGFINAQMMIIRPKREINSDYLLDFIALESTQHSLMRGQSGSAVKQLTAKQIGELEVVVPSEQQQTIYRSRISSIHQLSKNVEAHIQRLDELFGSLQSRAFRGGL